MSTWDDKPNDHALAVIERLRASNEALVAALGRVRSFCWDHGASDEIMNLIDAAIAKSIGET